MLRSFVPAVGAALLLAGCGAEYDAAPVAERVTSVDIAEPAAMAPAQPPQSGDASAGGGEISVPRAPQIAYIYDYGYRLAASRIAPLQRRHADLCESKGPNVCRILSMEQFGSEGDYVSGSLRLEVAAAQARAFGDELTKQAEGSGGEQVSAGISGEDLSKQIVDTEARLRARTLLRDRLMEVLASRKGTVAELVEAERGVAQVNEEIDQARSWLEEMKGRVNFSRVNVSYQSGSPSAGGFLAPIRDALGSAGAILGTVIATLIVLVVGLAPIAGLAILLIWLNRKFGWVKRRRDTDEEAVPPVEG